MSTRLKDQETDALDSCGGKSQEIWYLSYPFLCSCHALLRMTSMIFRKQSGELLRAALQELCHWLCGQREHQGGFIGWHRDTIGLWIKPKEAKNDRFTRPRLHSQCRGYDDPPAHPLENVWKLIVQLHPIDGVLPDASCLLHLCLIPYGGHTLCISVCPLLAQIGHDL